MIKSKYLDLLLPTNTEAKIKDMVFIQDFSSVERYLGKYHQFYPTDYAVMNGANVFEMTEGDVIWPAERQSCQVYLRPFFDNQTVVIKEKDGSTSLESPTKRTLGICPSIRLDAKKLINNRELFADFKIDKIYEDADPKYTVKLGQMPQEFVGVQTNDKLNYLYKNNMINSTGKTYFGGQYGNKVFCNKEYEFDGQKYVRTRVFTSVNEIEQNNSLLLDLGYAWTKVEPISWYVLNYDRLPKQFNPYGSGKDDFLLLTTCNAMVAGLPFCFDLDKNSFDNVESWETSPIRKYLNGNSEMLDLKDFFTSGNLARKIGQHSFLEDAFYSSQIMPSKQLPLDKIIVFKDTNDKNLFNDILEYFDWYKEDIEEIENYSNVSLGSLEYAKNYINNNDIANGQFDKTAIPFDYETKENLTTLLFKNSNNNQNVRNFIKNYLGKECALKYKQLICEEDNDLKTNTSETKQKDTYIANKIKNCKIKQLINKIKNNKMEQDKEF